MKPAFNDPLFELIKSLDKNEKGYFKKFAARYGEKTSGNEYLKLFDVLDKMVVYDEQKIRQLTSNQAGKKINLSAQKNYLHQQIIKSLRSYASGKSTLFRIGEQLLDIQNLSDKNLIHQALELLMETKRLAVRIESYDKLLTLLLLEESLLQRNWGVYTEQQIASVKKEVESTIRILADESTLSKLLFDMKLLDDERGKKALFDDSLMSKADEIVTHKLINHIEQLSRKGKMMAYATLHYHAAIKGNDAEALHYMKQRHKVFEDMDLDSRALTSYLANISNIILASLNVGQITEAKNYLEILQSNSFRDKQIEEYRKRVLAKNTLMYLMVKSMNGITVAEVSMAEELYQSAQPQPVGNNNLMSAYYLSVLFYYTGNLDKCLYWLQQVTEHENVSYTNIQAYCRVLMGFIYFEMQQNTLAESALNAAGYFMKKQNISSTFLKKCMQICNKLMAAGTKKEMKEELQQAEKNIEEMFAKDLNGETTYFHDFNLLIWCRSKFNNTTYAEELQQMNSLALV